MDAESQFAGRLSPGPWRRPPREPVQVLATFDTGGDLGKEIPHGPIDLAMETTDAHGSIASWFTDLWWTDVIQRWGEDPVTLRLASTPGAILHPVVLHQMEMVRRVAPHWRLIAHAYTGDVNTDEAVTAVSRSPYHEIRFVDEPRPGVARSERWLGQLSLDQLFGRIRREQGRVGASTPILVRLPAKDVPADSPKPDAQRDSLARSSFSP